MSLEILILTLCTLGFWVVFEVIKGTYGEKIKAKLAEHVDKHNAIKIWDGHQMEIKLNFAKSQEIEHVEVEVVEDKDKPQRWDWEVRNEYEKYSTKLIK